MRKLQTYLLTSARRFRHNNKTVSVELIFYEWLTYHGKILSRGSVAENHYEIRPILVPYSRIKNMTKRFLDHPTGIEKNDR